jgi:hypothetical protein
MPIGLLGLAAKVPLQNWTMTTRPVRDGVAERFRSLNSLLFLSRQIPGEFQICYHKDKEAALAVDGQGVHSLSRIAPWPIDALRKADFSELDASFKAHNPYVYSIPLAVIKNVGISLGLILGPTESSEIFTTFTEDQNGALAFAADYILSKFE